jgi:hypothetical protein
MREFDKLEEAEEIRELLRQVVRQPPGDVAFAEATEQLLPELFGGLSIALARSFRAVVLTGRIRVQIFGSPGARDSRYALPDSLFGSELRRTLQRVRYRPPLSALP